MSFGSLAAPAVKTALLILLVAQKTSLDEFLRNWLLLLLGRSWWFVAVESLEWYPGHGVTHLDVLLQGFFFREYVVADLALVKHLLVDLIDDRVLVDFLQTVLPLDVVLKSDMAQEDLIKSNKSRFRKPVKNVNS